MKKKELNIFYNINPINDHYSKEITFIALSDEYGNIFEAEITDDKEYEVEFLSLHSNNTKILSDLKNSEGLYSIRLRCNKNTLRVELSEWLNQFKDVERIQMWSDNIQYTWYTFYSIFDGIENLPKNICKTPDLFCLLFQLYNLDKCTNKEEFIKDNINYKKDSCLYNVVMNQKCFKKLKTL